MKKIAVIESHVEKTDLGEDSVMLYSEKHGETYVMNEMMYYIYSNCDKQSDVQIIDQVKKEFSLNLPENEEIIADILAALNELEEAGLIEQMEC